jgi:chitinase
LAADDRRVVGYFTAWGVGSKGYTPAKIPAQALTHLNYAFSTLDPASGLCVLGDPEADTRRFFTAEESVDGQADAPGGLGGNFNQLLKLKRKYPHLQALASIGGWTGSDGFSAAASTPASRRAFARSCVELHLRRFPGVFDGLDIDWEFPVGGGLRTGRPEDRQNFTRLLEELRRQLDIQAEADGRSYLLTIAASARPAEYANLELGLLHPCLDWINLMAYDFHLFGEARAHFNAPLFGAADDPTEDLIVRERFNADAAVRAYLEAGVPADKLVLGIPFYGRAWKVAPDGGMGLYGNAAGPADLSAEPGIVDFTVLAQNYIPRWPRRWHPQAQVPWLFSPESGIFISYDDPQSVALKVKYAGALGLGGVMFWELSCDGGELLRTIHAHLQPG